MKLLIKALQKRRLIMAIRAPRPANRNNYNLPIKLRIRIRNHLAIQVRKAELEPRRRILHRSLLSRIRRPHKLRRPRLRGSSRNQILLIIHIRPQKIRHQQSPIRLRSQRVKRRPSRSEMTDSIAAVQSTNHTENQYPHRCVESPLSPLPAPSRALHEAATQTRPSPISPQSPTPLEHPEQAIPRLFACAPSGVSSTG